jgi:hypothetical protein
MSNASASFDARITLRLDDAVRAAQNNQRAHKRTDKSLCARGEHFL